jgi:hypothetical protein
MNGSLAEQIAERLGLKMDSAEECQIFADEYASAHERIFGAPFIVN